jgi:hypothetical protein
LVEEGNKRMGKLMRKWFPDEEQMILSSSATALPASERGSSVSGAANKTEDIVIASTTSGPSKWDVGKGARVIVDLATSYAIVKVLMPVRLAASLALTPWFAR